MFSLQRVKQVTVCRMMVAVLVAGVPERARDRRFESYPFCTLLAPTGIGAPVEMASDLCESEHLKKNSGQADPRCVERRPLIMREGNGSTPSPAHY